MIFNPRSSPEQDNSQDTSTAPFSYLNVPYHLPYRDQQGTCGMEEWQTNSAHEDNTRSTMNSLNMSNVSVSYDIYGNELPPEDDEIPRNIPGSYRDLGLESIEEEEIMSQDLNMINQENKDPILHMITPVKRRSQQRSELTSERRSFISRSPLLDITPGTSRRKGSHQSDGRTERSFLGTPKNEQRTGNVDTLFPTRKLR